MCPYGIKLYWDRPQFGYHAAPGPTDSCNHFYQWSSVCFGGLFEDSIYVTCALVHWQWTQNNGYPWINFIGAVINGGIRVSLVESLQWSFLFTNSGNGE